jgi:hypothetical protein
MPTQCHDSLLPNKRLKQQIEKIRILFADEFLFPADLNAGFLTTLHVGPSNIGKQTHWLLTQVPAVEGE